MSLYWDLRCVDCGVDAGFDNANRMMTEMQALAAGSADLGRAFKAILAVHGSLLGSHLLVDSWGFSIPVAFFVEHGDHRLRPVDEYGRFDTLCAVEYSCARCGQNAICCEREHPGLSHGHVVDGVWHWG